jgi:hypothetical protein
VAVVIATRFDLVVAGLLAITVVIAIMVGLGLDGRLGQARGGVTA